MRESRLLAPSGREFTQPRAHLLETIPVRMKEEELRSNNSREEATLKASEPFRRRRLIIFPESLGHTYYFCADYISMMRCCNSVVERKWDMLSE